VSQRSATGRAALFGTAVFASARAAGAAELSAGDTAWMLTSSALVLLMTLPGLALFYGGLVRAKNVLSVLMQCAISAGLVGLLWVIAGYSLAFAEGNGFIGDLSKALKAVLGDLRVSEEEEWGGIDLAEHSETAYTSHQ
jgi:ammonium transporter, Amt family